MSRIFFADEPAIDRTVAEHRGALDRVRKERKKGLDISLTGIGVKIEEQERYLPLTLPEKIALLRKLLEAEGVLSTGRPNARNDAARYVQEWVHAVRVVVPEVEVPPNRPKPAFSFWLSPATEARAALPNGR